MSEQLGQVVLYILGVIVIIIAAYYTTYYLGKRTIRTASGRSIKLRDRFALSKDKGFYLMELNGKVYFIAVTGESATLLDTMTAEELGESSEAAPEPPGGKAANAGAVDFFKRFAAAMRVNMAAVVKPGAGAVGNGDLYDLDERIKLQSAKEEDNLDAFFREIQTGRARRKAAASRGDEDEEK